VAAKAAGGCGRPRRSLSKYVLLLFLNVGPADLCLGLRLLFDIVNRIPRRRASAATLALQSVEKGSEEPCLARRSREIAARSAAGEDCRNSPDNSLIFPCLSAEFVSRFHDRRITRQIMKATAAARMKNGSQLMTSCMRGEFKTPSYSSATSIASFIAASSGAVREPKVPAIEPSLLNRYLWKFHLGAATSPSSPTTHL